MKTIAVLPELSDEFDSAPFSLLFILRCYLRVLERTDHATLNGDNPVEAASILFGFMKAFRNFKKSQLTGVDQIQTFDFVGESKSKVTFPTELRDAVSNCFSGNEAHIKKFVELIEEYRSFWGKGATRADQNMENLPEFIELMVQS